MRLLTVGLATQMPDVVSVDDLTQATKLLIEEEFDVIVLGEVTNGSDTVGYIRRLWPETLVLAVRENVQDRINLLEHGADAVLDTEDARLIQAQINSLLHRFKRDVVDRLEYADVTVDTQTRKAWRNDRELELTSKAFDVLVYFMQNPRRVIGEDEFMQNVWGYTSDRDSNLCQVYVHHLRKELGAPRIIQTVRGVGYVLRIREKSLIKV